LREEAEVGIEAKYEGGISLQMVVKTKERTESHLSATECYSVTRREFPRAAFVDAGHQHLPLGPSISVWPALTEFLVHSSLEVLNLMMQEVTERFVEKAVDRSDIRNFIEKRTRWWATVN
jgi:hypothetical protein